MNLELQFKIKENNYYLRYLRENSYWYKTLNRAPGMFRNFEDEVRRYYKITRADKVARAVDTFEMLEKILSSLK